MSLQTHIDIYKEVEEMYTNLKDIDSDLSEEKIQQTIKSWFQLKIWSSNVNHANHRNLLMTDCVTCNIYHNFTLAASIYDQCNGDLVAFKKECYGYIDSTMVDIPNDDDCTGVMVTQ